MRFVGVLARKARATSVALGTSAGHASPSARASENNTGRLASEITVRRHARHDGRHPPRAPSMASSASTSASRRRRSSPRTIRRAAGVLRTRDALSTSAVSAGIPPCARRSRRAQVRRAPVQSAGAAWRSPQRPARRRPSRPAEEARGRDRRAPARPRRDARSAGGGGPRDSAHARHSPGRRALERRPRGVERLRGPAQVARDQRDLGLGDDASRAGQRLVRTEGARSGRSSAFARSRSPSCAIAMPRRASAGASSRSATRFKAPADRPPRARVPQP